MATQTQPAIPFYVTGTARHVSIPACSLTANDLRRLFRLLQQKASEAADNQLAAMTQQPGQTQEQFEELKTAVRGVMAPVVRLQTKGGGWTGSVTTQPLEEEQLPDGVTQVQFDSALLFRLRFNNSTPNNYFLITIDLARPPVLDMSPQPIPNASIASVFGADLTWANGLCDELTQFFNQTANRRGWLHFAESYTMLMITVGIPLSLIIVYYLDRLVRRVGILPEALSVAMYVYIVLIVLYLFRLLFNYARWVFPKVELDAPRQHIGVRHRFAISALALMVVGALVRAALKVFGIG
jgi:hypothetical protein